MKRVGFLFDRIVDFQALLAATGRAARGKHDCPVVARFLVDRETEVLRLQAELLAGAYRPGAFRTFTVHDPKTRLISAPAFRDRVVHHVVCAAIEPVLERVAIHDSYACRVGKGAHRALDRAQQFVRAGGYFLKLDVHHYYDTVDHAVLKRLLRRVLKDPRVLALLDVIIDHGAPDGAPGRGLPIGSLTSQHLANFYLAPLDHFVKERLGVRRYVRYMDDLLLFGAPKDELWDGSRHIGEFLAAELRLTLKPAATVVAPVSEGVRFLGVRIWPSLRRLSRRRKTRFLRAMRGLAAVPTAAAVASAAGAIEAARMADTLGLRRAAVRRLWGMEDRGTSGLEPGDPRRFLEQQRQERPGGEPEQERPGEPQREHRVPPLEFSTSARSGASTLRRASPAQGGADAPPAPRS